MNSVRNFIILTFITLVFIAKAQDNFVPITDNSVKNKFKKNAVALTSIQCDFVQEKHLDFLASTVLSKGKFWFKTGNKLRWEYTEPFKYIVLVVGKKITVVDENNTSVYKKQPNNAFKYLNKILASSVQGSLVDNPNYKFEVSQNATFFKVHLIPLNTEEKSVFSHLDILFKKTEMSVYQVKMVEPNKDSITLTFENKKENIPIADKVFSDI